MTGPSGAADGARTLYLVDGSGFIFRAYHALPPLTRDDGTPVNAVYGFTNMLMKLLTDFHAGQIAVIFDAARENFRNDIYADYKANRDDPPDELVPQFGLIRDCVGAFALPSLELEGYEADDLIATYARLARKRGQTVVIVSSDKDLMQLVGDGVTMFDPIKNREIGVPDVVEKFGVEPAKVVDVQSLAGDSVDNVPGVPGIGVKTAAQLITEYGDLETLLASTDRIKQPKRRQSLIDHAEAARVSQKLVRLETHVPVPVGLDDLVVAPPDYASLRAFLEEQGFRSVVSRLERFSAEQPMAVADGGPTPAAAQMAAADPASYPAVTTLDALDTWIARAWDALVIAVDTETDSLVPSTTTLVGLSLATDIGAACYVPIGHRDAFGQLVDGQLDLADVVERLAPLMAADGILKVGHNIKFDLQVMAAHGLPVAPVDDTMLLSYVVDGGSHGHGMDELAELHCGMTPIKFEEVAGKGKAQVTFDQVPIEKATPYAAEDAEITLRLHRLLKQRLVEARQVALYETIERPLVPVIAAMEARGIKVDRSILAAMSQDFEGRLGILEGEIQALAGREFNVGSPKQLGEILFEEMGLAGGKKSKTGWSTASDVLEPLAAQGHEIAEKVLDWRQLSKLKSTYTDALQQDIQPTTGRVHTSFSLALTNTGRLSSSDPNLQNIPVRTEEGRRIRTAFVAEDGHLLLSVDYSQIELRLVAEIAGIDALRQAFRDGQDIHAITASQVFGVPMAAMTPDIRSKAKAINFGIIYGISGFGLARQIGTTPGEAKHYIDQYLERLPELKTYMDETKAFVRQHGYVTTRFGRRCYMPGITDKNPARRQFAERQAINAPIQGTAADIIKRAMIRVPKALAAAGLSARMLLQVHDELVFEVPEGEVEATARLVSETMQAAAPEMATPLIAEAKWGASWAEAH